MTDIKLHAILACDLKNGIGKENQLPWSVPEDYAYFLTVAKTTHDPTKINALIFGRFTWHSGEQGGSPVPKCLNVVVSTRAAVTPVEHPVDRGAVIFFNSMEAAVAGIRARYSHLVESIIVCGGAGPYEYCWTCGELDRLYLTRIHGVFDCDVFIRPANFLKDMRRLTDAELERASALYKCRYNVMHVEPSNGIEYILEAYEYHNLPQ